MSDILFADPSFGTFSGGIYRQPRGVYWNGDPLATWRNLLRSAGVEMPITKVKIESTLYYHTPDILNIRNL